MVKEYISNFLRYEVFIAIGLFMAAGTLIKLIGLVDFSSDWFWFLAAIGLVVEGTIAMLKQKQFDRKYKIVERDAFEK